jgi:hypothetical protein
MAVALRERERAQFRHYRYVTPDYSSFFRLLPVIKGYKRQISAFQLEREISFSHDEEFGIRIVSPRPSGKYAIGKRYFTRTGFRVREYACRCNISAGLQYLCAL